MRTHEKNAGQGAGSEARRVAAAPIRGRAAEPGNAILDLQRAQGNHFVQRLITAGKPAALRRPAAVARAVTAETPAVEPGQEASGPVVRRQGAGAPYVARATPVSNAAGPTSQEKILHALMKEVPAEATAREVHLNGLRKVFGEAATGELAVLQSRLAVKNPQHDPLPIYFQKLPADWQQELMGILKGKADAAAKPAPAPAPAPALAPGGTAAAGATPAPPPAATLSTDRTANQRAHLELVRGVQKEVTASFTLLDAELATTLVYDAMVQVRDNVMKDVETSLSLAEVALAGSNPGALAPKVQTHLEQAQLWLHYVVPYAHLGAVIRSAEHDKLVTDVITLAGKDATNYASAFSAIRLGTPAALAAARTRSAAILGNTQKLFVTLKNAIAEGQKLIKTAHHFQTLVDVPLEFAAGAVLPPTALATIVVHDRHGFYRSHKAQFDKIAADGPALIAELGWIEVNAPHSRQHVLHPIFQGMARDSYNGISATDVAFILGRAVYLLAKGKSPVSVKTFTGAAVKASAIVTALHSPKLLVAGLASLTKKTRESVVEAIGGSQDPKGIVAEVNKQLGANLTADEVADLLLELSTPPVEDHIKNLAAAVAAVGPNIAAIVTDAQGAGGATSAASSAATAINSPLLPAAP